MSAKRRRRRDAPRGPRERVRVELTGVAHGGEAIGRVEGRVVFVPYGLPGEVVVAEITRDKGDYARAEIVSIERRAPERTVPPCVYFGACGGCQWQHAEYAAQLTFKQGIVAEQLRRIGGFAASERYVLPTLGMVDPWHYRNHARFSVGRRYGEVGFTRMGTRSLLRIDHCRISHPEINDVLERVQRRLPGLSAHQLAVRVGANTGDRLINPELPPLTDHAPTVPVRSGATSSDPDCPQTVPDVASSGRHTAPLVAAGAPPAEHVPAPPSPGVSPDAAEARARTVRLASGQRDLYEELLGRRFRVAAPAFFQVNTRRERRGPDFPSPEIARRFGHLIPEDGLSIAETLVLVGLDRLDPRSDDVVVDAYCGVGTFAALIAPLVRSVVGIEESTAAVRDAERNCHDLPNARFVAGKTEAVLPKLEERPTKVLLDPARVGCEPGVLAALIEATPQRIVYVSCEPATLARDLAILREGGYTLQSVQPIDMFPQTYHVESVSLLTL